MGVSEILGILNLVGLLAVAVLLILHLRRRTDGQATAVTAVTAVTPEDLLRSEEKLTGSFRKESEAAVQALRREIGDSRRETGDSVQNAVTRLGNALRQSQSDAAEAQKQQLAALTDTLNRQIGTLTGTLDKQIGTLSDTVTRQMTTLTEAQEKQMAALTEAQEKQMAALTDGQRIRLDGVTQQVTQMAAGSEKAQEQMRKTLDEQLSSLRTQNNDQLEKMRATVDEKLQQTLNERISQSFKLVNDRLSEVYQGLGEMKTLAGSVGDLRKVLSGVKTRGILGEVQLGAIVEDMLTPYQYEKNVCTRKGSHDPVEYAVRLPGDGEEPVYLPIDAKFPGDTYGRLADAYESGDPAAVREAQAVLADTIRREAKDIRDKYIDPPNTTDFGILFLPTEGLYAEAVRLGLPEKLRREYHVSIAGPTTLAALLNSLQLGFRTLVIQKRSGEVWKLLGAVKKEFGTFEDALTAAQMRIRQTGEELDKLVGVRTRQINRKLKSVELSSAEETAAILPPDAPGDGEDT